MDRETLHRNLDGVRERIGRAAERSGRPAASVRLMAVTKTLPLERALAAAALGIALFGENRVQEAQGMWSESGLYELHLIGHLQRNKAKTAAALFAGVDSIDKAETARELARHCAALGKSCDVLLEVNTSAEETKSGVRGEAGLLELLSSILGLPELRVRGLMTVGPLTDDRLAVRRSFSELRAMLDACRRAAPSAPLDTLSMGMSSDFEIAVEEGSTMVRLGTALFGPRKA